MTNPRRDNARGGAGEVVNQKNLQAEFCAFASLDVNGGRHE